jgi:hypothetical protein
MHGRLLVTCSLALMCLLPLSPGCQSADRTTNAPANETPTSRAADVPQTVEPTTQYAERKTKKSLHKGPGADFKGEKCCCDQLAKIYCAIHNIDFKKRPSLWKQLLLSQRVTRQELEAHFGKDGFPTCCPTWLASHEGRQDYFLADEGPEPTKCPGLLAYERAGNHGDYRHILMEDFVWVVTEDQWEAMRQDRRYVPKATKMHLNIGYLK